MQQIIIAQMDAELAMTPMPEEYREKRVRVQCNDCSEKMGTAFHILGLKCGGCGSYNTTKIGEDGGEEDETLSEDE